MMNYVKSGYVRVNQHTLTQAGAFSLGSLLDDPFGGFAKVLLARAKVYAEAQGQEIIDSPHIVKADSVLFSERLRRAGTEVKAWG
jgi:hypothetical protein